MYNNIIICTKNNIIYKYIYILYRLKLRTYRLYRALTINSNDYILLFRLIFALTYICL